MEIVLDNYRGGEVKEIKIDNRDAYSVIVSEHLIQDSDNLVTVRGEKSYTIELGNDGLYSVYLLSNPTNRTFLPLDLAIDYAWVNVNKKID